ncbi:hypothetical protein MIR68_006425 [Amoeboaphelidium protococcarum]|nr:hypothetical protein MIR68_006425 [Amoeboaphelidium protococcarum]
MRTVPAGPVQRLNTENVRDVKIAIVHAEWHLPYIKQLVDGIKLVLDDHQMTRYQLFSVPGSYELPLECQRVLQDLDFDIAIAVGILIKGGTMHFEYIASAVSQGLMDVQLRLNKPVVFGVLTCLNEDQVKERCGLQSPTGSAQPLNHGLDWGRDAIRLILQRYND